MPSELPLSGVLVLDLSQLIAGPSAASVLRDLGAEVTKVERLQGELVRSVGSDAAFLAYNGGKRSVALDLTKSDGVDLFKRMIERADVVLEGFRPGAMERLGLGADVLHEINPRLIYVSVAAYGPDPRNTTLSGVDSVIQAQSGIMSSTGDVGGPPLKVGFQVVDAATGLAIAMAVTTALYDRERSGAGITITTSLFETATFLQRPNFVRAAKSGEPTVRAGNAASNIGAPSDIYQTSDGIPLMIVAYAPHWWATLCATLGLTELLDDPRFVNGRERLKNASVLRPIIAEVVGKHDAAHWEKVLTDAGIIHGVVRDHRDVLSSEHARSLGTFIDQAEAMSQTRPMWVPAVPIHANRWATVAPAPPPALGEDTEEVLRQLGIDNEEIARLRASGVLLPETTSTNAPHN